MTEPTYQWPRLRDLPSQHREAFSKWLQGQTVPLVNKVPADQQDFYYPHDYQRWIRLNNIGWEVWD